jgi:hypothetical protein
MDLLRTDRTYATRANAVKALQTACDDVGIKFHRVRYVIATNDAGRFAPVVTPSTPEWDLLVHRGVTAIS